MRQPGLAPRAMLQAGGAQHPDAERLDQAALLGERHELVRRHQPELRMAPAQQGLEPDDRTAVQLDLRLVEEHELTLLERPAQPPLEHHLLEHPDVEGRVVELEAVAAALLGAIQRHVGALEQLVRSGTVLGIEADPDAGGDVQLVAADVERRPDRLEDLLRRLDRVLGVLQPAQNEDELVAAHARDGVLGAHRGAQAAAQRDQQGVADGVAQGVVDDLETIEIEEQDRQHLLMACALLERGGEAVVEQGAIGQPGQDVVGRMEQDLFLGRLARGDVADRDDQPCAARADRRPTARAGRSCRRAGGR